MSERGAISLMLIGGLGILLVIVGLVTSLKVQSTRLAHSKAETKQCKLDYENFRDESAALGAKAQRETEARNRDNQIILAKQLRETKQLLNRAVFAERKLRQRAPERPDSSLVPITTCNSEGAARTPGEFVSLEEFRQLEGRALRDTQRCALLQRTILELHEKGLVEVK